jgi:hypothetical protein
MIITISLVVATWVEDIMSPIMRGTKSSFLYHISLLGKIIEMNS